MKTILMVALTFICVSGLWAQNKKTVKEIGVSYRTEWKYKYDDGEELKYKESEVSFDKRGNVLMEKTYDEDGKILSHMEYKYDENDNVIVETTFNNRGKLSKREEYKYQGNLKTEKKTFDADGTLKSKKVYEYKTF